ncbi:RNA polymerase sigma-70 factor (ECF subfamily) [Mangrovibacterium marinum]|uniref:RNA polymerase sigma-70 factor (ECF subfamily) n=1 Tax=Mangrovibacterium marinum TaxID=1639118 RepID=A0A2T5C423_9BACT|nr:RNA polymerase sigma-70 factor [Mangrovibacterium marinum]PTN09522.1 RNA polymerase sigma-70 factor (ECF subfamily) [Mangrovibacterium marinum]
MNFKLTKTIPNTALQTEKQFESVFREYFVRLCCFADRYTNNAEESKEVVQDVFLKVWNKRDLLPLDDDLKFYLFRSVKNACLNMLQHKRVVDKFQSVLYLLYAANEKDNMVVQSLEAAELQDEINAAIAGLPSECRRIFLLSRESGLKYAEIAEELNISVKTVETQMSRALSCLRSSLKDYL